MYISVELSYYPLADEYLTPISTLIDKLKASELEVHPNRMSTQIFGDHETVMRVLGELMAWSFEEYGKAVFVAKFLAGDRRPHDTP